VNFNELKEALTNNPDFFRWFLNEVTVNVTEMFRDPSFYKTLNTLAVPYLSEFKNVSVWSAGCSSGEEVYSLVILLNEAGLKVPPFFYGTDINTAMIEEAQKGIYNMRKIKSYAENYKSCELPGELTDHFNITNDVASVKKELKQNTLFSTHNLVTNDAFNEFQMISCRNVFIYFEAELQERILGLFYKSLCPNGFLCLGSKETIRFPGYKNKFRVISQKENIYQKVG
jgi:chemotaxis protein methyltransferase CheR